MSSIDQQFVEYIIKSIVGNPDDVQIERTIDEKGVLLELTVNPEDLGRVIGKRGATAQSIRTLLRALGTKNDARYNLKIIDNSPEGSRPPRNDDRPQRSDEDSSQNGPADDSSATPVADDSASDDTAVASAKDDDLADLRDEDDTSESVSRTRKELEDLDDLDV